MFSNKIYCRIGWQLTSDEGWNTELINSGSESNNLKRLFFTFQQGKQKSLMKTLRLHIIVIKPSRYMPSQKISRRNAIAAEQWPRLPGWPFLGQISGIWPCLKSVGQKCCLAFWSFFRFNSSWFVLKNSFGLLAFLAFLRWKSSSEGKYYHSILIGNTFAKYTYICNKCYIRPMPAVWC